VFSETQSFQPLERFSRADKPLKRFCRRAVAITTLKQGVNESASSREFSITVHPQILIRADPNLQKACSQLFSN
jgi:hypothetical protein